MGREIAILGAGGFAREVEWLIRESFVGNEKRDFLGYLVSDKSTLGEYDSREQVLGDLSWLENHPVDELYLGMGNPAARLKLGREISQRFPHIKFPWIKHPSVIWDDRSIKISRGAIICADSVFTVNITIGEFAMVNLCCTIGHEGQIGAGCVLNPDVNISGGVVLGEGVLVGTGAQILQNLNVGDSAVVGAGALVTKDVPIATTVVGIPAKPR